MANIFIGNIKGPQGATGATGAQGEQGEAATIAVGSVTTVPYGQNARVNNSGTEHEAVFDFTIPQGRPGEQTTKIDNLTIDAITEPSTEFPVPAVGDNGSTLFGKITKWFSDMRALVNTKLNSSAVVNNLTTEDSGKALDARQGKALKDALDATQATAVTNYSSYLDSSYATGTVSLIQIGKVGIYNFDITVLTGTGTPKLMTGLPRVRYTVQGMCAVFAQARAMSSYVMANNASNSCDVTLYAPLEGRYIFSVPVILA